MQWQKRSVALRLGLTVLSLGQFSLAAEDQRAQEIVDRVARLFSSKSSIATVGMQISTENWQRNLSMKIWSLGAENVLVHLYSPPEEASTVTLKGGDLIALKRKHTAQLNLLEELHKAVLRYEMGYQQYQQKIEYLRGTIWHPKEARDRIYTAFAEKIIPVRLFHDIATPYLHRDEPCTAWEVLNTFTHAMRKLKPSIRFDATVKLGRFFSSNPCDVPASFPAIDVSPAL